MKKYFRFHAGSLDASMKTQVEVKDLNDLKRVVNENGPVPDYYKNIRISNVEITDTRLVPYGWGDKEYRVIADFKIGIEKYYDQCIGYANFWESALVNHLAYFASQGGEVLEEVEEFRKEKKKAWKKILDGLTPKKIEMFCKIPMPDIDIERVKKIIGKIEKHEHWVNIYKNGNGRMIYTTLFDSYDDAYDYARCHCSEDPDVEYITTVKLEWEE